MREKELRLALVCFGGVSLAIYMHGVTKEVLKLARASAAYHRDPDPDTRRATGYDDSPNDDPISGADEVDTELVYFEILKTLGEVVDLRVVIDAVAGASAGGINGIFLSRALAHDLNYDPLRHLWLEEADVSKLAAENLEAPTFWTRFVVRPIVDAVTKRLMGQTGLRKRVSEKLPAILRVRRIKPPFDGPHLVRLLYTGLKAMGTPHGDGASLMPGGHRLDTFVTVTDFHGYLRQIPLHDPPMIIEREHRLTLNFSYVNWPGGQEISDFADRDLPSLAFAARATASFPGAYPPAQLGEVDDALSEIGVTWDTRDAFVARSFADHLASDLDPHRTSFIDGSVLNNKPFSHAIRSIEGRPAYRAVDRRIVYIDPTPDELVPPPSGVVPSLWRTLKGALSDIPRNEPMHDDLAEIESFNNRVKMIRSVIDSVKPSVNRYMAEIMDLPQSDSAIPGTPSPATGTKTIRDWRIAANARAARDAGYSYEGYTRLKLRMVTLRVTDLLATVSGFPRVSVERNRLAAAVEAWVMRDPLEAGRMTVPDDEESSGDLPNWIAFLLAFDVDYQRRRVRFVIQELNALYGRINGNGNGSDTGPDTEGDTISSADLDRLKTRFYDCLALLRRFDDRSFVDPAL
ncbi:MAG: patatin-like protein, partial [Sphingomonadales bacterium]